MALGSLIVPGELVAAAEKEIDALLSRHSMGGAELKWTKISKGKADAYRSLFDLYLNYLSPQGAEFHALLVPNDQLDHRTYNLGDPDLGFNKFIYNLLFHRTGKRFGHAEKIVVDLDSRNTTRDVLELQTCLNRAVARAMRSPTHMAFSRVAFRNSKSSRLLQLSDLLTGLVAWHKNSHDAKTGASPIKTEIANYVAGRVGVSRFGSCSPRNETRVSVWNFRLGPRNGRPAA